MKVSRPVMAIISIILCAVVIAALTFLLPERVAKIILDYEPNSPYYPFTIQNIMLLLFVVGLGELLLRWGESSREMAYIANHYLPDQEDDRTVLQSMDLGEYRQKVLPDIKPEGAFLPNMINRCILRFQASKSVDETNSVLNSIVDIYFHQIDLKYTILRYIAWVIPTMGFIGTVVGIASSLSLISVTTAGSTTAATSQDIDLAELTARLGVAFNTTLVALMLSAILVFFIHIIQEKEERSLNKAMEYCLNNLVNRLYTVE